MRYVGNGERIQGVNEKTNTPVTKYHIVKREMGVVSECLKRAEAISELKKEHEKMEKQVGVYEWRTLKLLFIYVLLMVIATFTGLDDYLQDTMQGKVALGMAIVIYVGYYLNTSIQTRKIEKKFYTYANGVVGNGTYEPFYSENTYYKKKYETDRNFEWKEKVLRLVEKELGDCVLYKIDNPLILKEELPKGMELASYWIFDKDGEYYQVAIGKGLEEQPSYMILPVITSTIKTEGRFIEQEVE